ncbi:hypothetical protein COCSUDRAFT_45633 [Coccomyxa subellipsoidea C-169]|uniref:Secreted protein n=1 Tax=Coccomyxa subellipsoidea (strain C-169) TaxID=574566 RepID=I0YI67_COCSC|nr:hypothetical protein COCSUDRAFT_45633 [Coccomyxa subellipsoidea C-169]EIE18086.1 hypothetical protein COCSUDRAFT_45633 [Coccomyxa subellipsoidea C-169]|eukprot:XP_005642630.1 hypothetical protein COCSUDRAFT_45633 [Coccomyxa subellipsoidea C-169]
MATVAIGSMMPLACLLKLVIPIPSRSKLAKKGHEAETTTAAPQCIPLNLRLQQAVSASWRCGHSGHRQPTVTYTNRTQEAHRKAGHATQGVTTDTRIHNTITEVKEART